MLNDVVALYTSDPALFAGSVFLLSLLIGSFLNVVIYRLPIILEREWRVQAAEALSTATASTFCALIAWTTPRASVSSSGFSTEPS